MGGIPVKLMLCLEQAFLSLASACHYRALLVLSRTMRLTAIVCVSIAVIDYGKGMRYIHTVVVNYFNARCAHRFSINAVTILKSLSNNSSYSFCRAARRGASTARCQDAAKSRSGLGEFNSVSAISSFSLMAATGPPIWIVRIVDGLLLVLGRQRE